MSKHRTRPPRRQRVQRHPSKPSGWREHKRVRNIWYSFFERKFRRAQGRWWMSGEDYLRYSPVNRILTNKKVSNNKITFDPLSSPEGFYGPQPGINKTIDLANKKFLRINRYEKLCRPNQ